MQETQENAMQLFIRRHFDHNAYTNTYRCKYCGKVDNLKYNQRTNNLYLHILDAHKNSINPSSSTHYPAPRIVFDRSQSERPIKNNDPQYNYIMDKDQIFNMNQDDDNEQTYSDEWLDRLALSGFPIRDILISMFSRHRQNSHAYAVYLENKALRLKNSIDKLKKYLNNKIPILAHPNQVSDQIVQKFRITPHGAKLVMEDFMLIYRNDYEVTDELRRRGMTIYRYEQDRMNTVVFFCDDIMKNNFSRYGDCVFANFRPCIIRRYGQNRKILVGTFTGQSTSIKHVLFGTCLILGESIKNYKILLRYFIRAMRMPYLPPGLIITDSENLAKAIKGLAPQASAYSPQSVASWYHLEQQLKNRMNFTDQEERQYILKKYMNILSSLKSEQINQLISDMKMGEMEKGNFQKIFMDNKQNIMGYKNPVFVGFGVERQHGKHVNQIIHKYMGQFQTLGFFYIQSMKMFQYKMDVRSRQVELIRFQQFKNFQVPLSDQLRYLSIRLEKLIFMKFLTMYKIALNEIKVIGKTDDNLMFFVVQNPPNINYQSKRFVYTVKYCIQSQCWKCNCRLLFWSGLPCTHLLKIIRIFRGSLTYYINRRWLIHNEKFNPNKIHHPQQAKMEPQYDGDYEKIFNPQQLIQNKQKQIRYKERDSVQEQILIDQNDMDEEENAYLNQKQKQKLVDIKNNQSNQSKLIQSEKKSQQKQKCIQVYQQKQAKFQDKRQQEDEDKWPIIDQSIYKVDQHQQNSVFQKLRSQQGGQQSDNDLSSQQNDDDDQQN